MITIDDREKDHTDKSKPPRPMSQLFEGKGVPTETTRLESGDYFFEGNGPSGLLNVVVERKRVGDLLSSCLDGRIGDLQAPRMYEDYGVAEGSGRLYLVVEGSIIPDWRTDRLQKWTGRKGEGGSMQDWEIGSRTVTLSTLRRFLLSFQEFFNMHAVFTPNAQATVKEIVTLYNWWTTPYDRHTAVRQFHVQQPVLSNGTLSLVRPKGIARVAKEVPGIGWETAMAIEREFETVEEFVLASAGRLEEVEGIGKKGARKIWEWWRKKEAE